MTFAEKLTKWYRVNKRDLPWRKTTDPYHIWLSEIILQQTRVDQGLSYYLKFIDNYPDVYALAKATEDDVLKSWQGLGYYSRARNLHKTAKHVAKEFNGVFPDNYADLLKLKGVGPYTAAAIASFSFKETVPVVDGNVYRVLSRVFLLEEAIDTPSGKRSFQDLAEELISKNNPDEYNQAIMEFGALQCTPKLTKCESCPIQNSCLAYSENRVSELPFKLRKTKVSALFIKYFVLFDGENIVIRKRNSSGIWANLFDFPSLEIDKDLDIDSTLDALNSNYQIDEFSKTKTLEIHSINHKLSHRNIQADFIVLRTQFDSLVLKKEEEIIPLERISNLGIPRLVEKFLELNVLD